MSTLNEIIVSMRNEHPPINSFDFVILHTCPTVLMDFEAIWHVMTPGGIMVMTSYDSVATQVVVVFQSKLYENIAYDADLGHYIHRYFDDTDKSGIYKKKTVDSYPNGGKKLRKNKNTLRYKPKKSRSYRNRRYHLTKRSGSKKLK